MSPASAGAALGAIPWGDWQFWVVTAACLGAAGWGLARAARAMRGRKRGVKATLTIGGKPAK